MNVKQLIAKLSTFPQSRRVVIHGYEGGVCDVHEVTEQTIALNVNKEWYYGPHEIVEVGKEKAVYIQ